MYTSICLLSGGQDSTTALFWAKQKLGNPFALIIDYGQKHIIEIESAKKIASIAEVDYQVLQIPFFKEIGDSALLDDSDVNEAHKRDDNLPASFVPGRNLIFITVASMIAYKKGVNRVVTGVCETDYSGYPDCRHKTIDAQTVAIQLGMDFPELIVHTPLMYRDKKETVLLAESLDGCLEAMKYSHTCYNGYYPPCGSCPSCILRQKGFKEAGIEDPIWSR
jgi:7-cyano-7-deazaguanine synthase